MMQTVPALEWYRLHRCMAELSACTGEREIAHAYIGLTLCIAKQVCAAEADAFTALKQRAEAEPELVSRRYESMEACVSRWGRENAPAQEG